MAGRNILSIDTNGFDSIIEKIEKLGYKVEDAVEDALGQACETVQDDTREAMAKAYLPAGGKYSKGETIKTIVEPNVTWQGKVAVSNFGFDKTKKGAGTLLITGTPKMKPNKELEKIYTRKKYMAQIKSDITDVLMDYVNETMSK